MNRDQNLLLIVEDSPTQAAELKHMLERNRFRVEYAANGKAALALLEEVRPMAIISDVVMPQMDGYELCRRIKATPALSELPVILLTALSDPADVISGLECGADFFIMKPYNEKFLIARLQYILANRSLNDNKDPLMGLEISFRGQKYFINSNRLQILNMLLYT